MKPINDLSKQARKMIQQALEHMPEKLSSNLKLKAISLLKIPMIAFLNPKVIEIDDDRIVIRIPLNYRSKNHLGSMYFGALAVGADLAVGLFAVRFIDRESEKIQLVFKDFHAEYLKRPEGDVLFICDDGRSIAELVEEAAGSSERVEKKINCHAIVASDLLKEPAAKFQLTLSLKRKTKK